MLITAGLMASATLAKVAVVQRHLHRQDGDLQLGRGRPRALGPAQRERAQPSTHQEGGHQPRHERPSS